MRSDHVLIALMDKHLRVCKCIYIWCTRSLRYWCLSVRGGSVGITGWGEIPHFTRCHLSAHVRGCLLPRPGDQRGVLPLDDVKHPYLHQRTYTRGTDRHTCTHMLHITTYTTIMSCMHASLGCVGTVALPCMLLSEQRAECRDLVGYVARE
jgi:hypothetical protein